MKRFSIPCFSGTYFQGYLMETTSHEGFVPDWLEGKGVALKYR